MEGSGEFGDEIVESVGRTLQACEQDERAAEAAPVKNFKLEVFINRNQVDRVMSSVLILHAARVHR
jgi:hypothetical protein